MSEIKQKKSYMVAELCVGGMSDTDGGFPLEARHGQQSFWKQETTLQIQGYIQYCFSGQLFFFFTLTGKRCPNVSATCHVTFCEVSFRKVLV